MKSGRLVVIRKAALLVTLVLILPGSRATVFAGGGRQGYPSTVPKEQLLYSFHLSQDFHPQANLIFDASGNLYGTDFYGGSRGAGAAFELSPQSGGGWTETVLHNFHSNSQDGRGPSSGLIFDAAGNLYGTTSNGGGDTQCFHGCGSVFELSPQSGGGWTEKILYSFKPNGQDGNYPGGGLIFDAAGNLYGVTGAGGTINSDGCIGGGCGTVFELSPQTGGSWKEQVLYNFTGAPDGGEPVGVIFDPAGNLYGTTFIGGAGACANGCGTVFEISPGSGGQWIEKVLHSFQPNGPDGNTPYGGVIFDTAGNLFGTTGLGGSFVGEECMIEGCGTVFELSPMSGGNWSEQVLYSFQGGTDGDGPAAGLAIDAGRNLYGTTVDGGGHSGCSDRGCGTVFEVSPKPGGGWSEKVLHRFRSGLHDGYFPAAGLILDPGGNLYGTTIIGGSSRGGGKNIHGGGIVFEVTP